MIELENNIGKQVQILSRKIKRKLDEEFSKCGITGVQAIILQYVYENSKHKKIYAKDIENEFDLRRPTVTGILQAMQNNNLIERKNQGQDARLKEVKITKKALEIINKVNISINKVENQLEKNISKQEIDYFLEILNKMSNNIEERRKEDV